MTPLARNSFISLLSLRVPWKSGVQEHTSLALHYRFPKFTC